jgi:hypothetical protein
LAKALAKAQAFAKVLVKHGHRVALLGMVEAYFETFTGLGSAFMERYAVVWHFCFT